MTQLDIFSALYPRFIIDKPVRLIELFGGIGSQAKALKNLGVDFEHYKMVEKDKYCVASYNAVHDTEFVPQDIKNVSAADLEIIDRDRYCYIMTYSFPCQDLSISGLLKGMKKGSGTRSGLLWEVERILEECGDNLPQVLLMENVPNVIGTNMIEDFHEWRYKLESLGYQNYVDLLNAKDFGIPQNRNRCFMVSLLGEYSYEFPPTQDLKLCLRDMLEKEVDAKYFLSDKMLKNVLKGGTGNFYMNPEIDLDTARPLTATMHKMHRAGCDNYVSENFIKTGEKLLIKEATQKGYAEAEEGDGVYINRPSKKRGCVQKGMIQTLKPSQDVGVVVNCPAQKVNKLFNIYGYDGGSYAGNVYGDDGLSPSLNTAEGGHRQPMVLEPKLVGGIGEKDWGKQWHQQNKLVSADAVAMAHPAQIPEGSYKYLVGNRIRKLTPKETWRLMGFTDEDFEKAEKHNSNTQLYKQAGNSIVVPVLEAIFRQMLGGKND